MMEPLAVAWHAVKKANFRAGDSALILGAGPVSENLSCQGIFDTQLYQGRHSLTGGPKVSHSNEFDQSRDSQVLQGIRSRLDRHFWKIR